MMQPRHKRLAMLALFGGALCVAIALTLLGLRENVTYFLTPTDVAEKRATLEADQTRFRLGGMVEKGSVRKGKDGLTLRFTVTDFKNTLKVEYHGLPPDLFREGQGVVAEGKITGPRFVADTLLAKHDEKYMPPELKKKMKMNE